MTAPPYTVVDGTTSASQIYAEDLNQYEAILKGQRDAGTLTLLSPLGTASQTGSVPTLSSGSLTGTFQWSIYWVTGVLDGPGSAHIAGRSLPSGTFSRTLSSQQMQLNISGVTVPTGAIGWGLARTKAGGSQLYLVPNSEQFLTGGSMPSTYTDNAADSTLVTTVQTTDTTGTFLKPVGMYLIQTITLLSNTTEVTFNNIPPIFQDLQVRFSGQSNIAASSDTMQMWVNNDQTSGNYSCEQFLGINNAASAQYNNTGVLFFVGYIPGNSVASGEFGGATIDIMNYAQTGQYKTFLSRCSGTTSSAGYSAANTGVYTGSSNPITRLDFDVNGGASQFLASSRFSLYGIFG